MGALQDAYEQRIEAGILQADTAQAAIIAKLDALSTNLKQKQREATQAGFLSRFFRRAAPDYRSVKSFYIYGKVGRGKTMIMDLFYASLPQGDKKRVHFNDFMNDVQNRLTVYRQAEKTGKTKLPPEGDFVKVAEDLARNAHILCFDEFSVTDIADAMILARLFKILFAHGVVLIATSNVAPADLYKNGLNRPLFLPFITLLEEKAEICNLDIAVDYRLQQGRKALFPVYQTPATAKAKAVIDAFWQNLTGQMGGLPQELKIRGHKIYVPCAAAVQKNSEFYTQLSEVFSLPPVAVRFDFAAICGQNFAAFDYAALAEHYALFCVENVPLFDEENRNEAKRFILLIDILYDRHLPLCLSAAAPPEHLYIGKVEITEKFEFDRTVSRLIEMQTETYLHHLGRAGKTQPALAKAAK